MEYRSGRIGQACHGARDISIAPGTGRGHIASFKEGMVAIGEIGYDGQAPLEERYVRAARAGQGA